MIHHFTTGSWIPLFLSLGYVPVSAYDRVIKVARGLDATLSCRSETSLPPKWEWTAKDTSNIKKLVINRTSYLLVENFQKVNEGQYDCISGTRKQSSNLLKIQQGIKNSTPVYRSTRSGSLNLSCEPLTKAKVRGFWSWGQMDSREVCKGPGSNLAHFGNRSKERHRPDKFALSISPLLWNDSGLYQCVLCEGRKHYKTCAYEVITVEVYSDPTELTEGDNASMVCEVSHEKEASRLRWVDERSRQVFESPEGRAPVRTFTHTVRNVTLERDSWTCAVFHLGRLAALVPLKLAVKRRVPPSPELPAGGTGSSAAGEPGNETSTHAPTGLSPVSLSLVCLAGLLLLSVVLALTVCWCRRHSDLTPKGDKQTPGREDVNYAEVHFKKKKAAAHASSSAACATDIQLPEEESVIYSGVALMTGIGRK